MPRTFHLNKGFNLPLVGRALLKEHKIKQPDSFAVKPSDFKGLVQPKSLVSVGENVKSGSPLFYDKGRENVLFVAPVSGEITRLWKEERLSKYVFYLIKKLNIRNLRSTQKQGFCITDQSIGPLWQWYWPSFIQRPFGIVQIHG